MHAFSVQTFYEHSIIATRVNRLSNPSRKQHGVWTRKFSKQCNRSRPHKSLFICAKMYITPRPFGFTSKPNLLYYQRSCYYFLRTQGTPASSQYICTYLHSPLVSLAKRERVYNATNPVVCIHAAAACRPRATMPVGPLFLLTVSSRRVFLTPASAAF